MKNKNDLLLKVLWLSLGLVLVFLAGGDQPVWLAVWLAPVFLLRFFRSNGAFKALLITLPLLAAVELVADKGMTPFPSFKILLAVTVMGAAFSLLPYLLDRILSRHLPVLLRIFFFPSLAITIPFVLGSFGTWGAKANGIDDLAMLQLVSVTGISGISFLIYWTATVANEIWEKKSNRKAVMKLGVAFLAVLTLVYAFGMIRLRLAYQPERSMLAAGMGSDPFLRDELMKAFPVLVQADPNQPEKMEAVRNSMKKRFHEMVSASMALAASGFELVVWSEAAVMIFEEDERSLIESAAGEAREKKVYLGISAAVYQNKSRSNQPGLQPLFKNKLILISPRGNKEWEYGKSILVPGMEAAITIPGDRRMKTSGAPIKITGAICYELDFPVHIRQAAMQHADMLLAPANDWEAIKNIHARMARLRAIENGISMLRPATGGVSIAVDPFGRILSQVDAYICKNAPLTASIPIGPVATIYSRLGNYFNWLCLILALTCLTMGIIFKVAHSRHGRNGFGVRSE